MDAGLKQEVEEERHHNLEKELEILKLRNEDLLRRLESYEDKVSSIVRENAKIKEDYQEIERVNASFEAIKRELNERITQLQNELDSMTEMYNKTDSELISWRNKAL